MEVCGLEEGLEEDFDFEIEGDAEEAEKLEAKEDSRKLRNLADPRKPTQAEVDEHNLSHLPYRNWCVICVKTKGRDLDHRKSIEEDRGLSEYSFDYCFPGDEFGYKLTALAGK